MSSLKRQVFKAGRWTAISALLVAGLQFLQTIVLARLLIPADFGLMAVTASLLAVITLFADFGLNRTIIHFDDIPSNTLATLYWFNLAMGLLLMILLILSAPFFGELFGAPDLVPILKVTSLVFPLTAIGQQFKILAEKHLRFEMLAGNEIASAIFGFIVAIAVAMNNGGVYALVAGVISSAGCNSLLAWWRLSHGYRPARHLCISEAIPFLRFGGYLVAESLASMLHRQSDIFIGGMISNPAAMGLFSLPRDLGLRIALVINPIMTRVGFPVMAKVKHDREKLKSIYLQTLRMTSSINFPIYISLALFAQDIVLLFFGKQWVGSVKYLQIFAVFGLIRSTGNPVGSLLYAVGKARRAFWWNISLLIILPLLLLLGGLLGDLLGLAIAALLIQVAIFVPLWWFLVRPACGASFLEYIRPLTPPLLIALVAGACAIIASAQLAHGTIHLLVGIIVGVSIYLALSAKFNRHWVLTIRNLLKWA